MSRIDWNDKALIGIVEGIAEKVAEEAAGWVQKDARMLLKMKAKHPTGKLASEIEIKKSKYPDGGWIVQAQGPANFSKYYASFVELGTYKDEALPFLRPALHKNKSRILRRFREMLS